MVHRVIWRVTGEDSLQFWQRRLADAGYESARGERSITFADPEGGGSQISVLDTIRAHLLYETGIRPVAYVPLEDFDTTLMQRTETSTHCPFKGDASYYDYGDQRDFVWYYPEPLPSVQDIRDHLAFYNDRVTLVGAE